MSHNMIFGFAAAALSDGHCPVYIKELHSPEEVRRTFASIFYGESISLNWLEVFQTKIFEMSWGKYRAETIMNTKEWPGLLVKGCVHYMKLVDTETDRVKLYFYIGPYSDPIKPAEATKKTILRMTPR